MKKWDTSFNCKSRWRLNSGNLMTAKILTTLLHRVYLRGPCTWIQSEVTGGGNLKMASVNRKWLRYNIILQLVNCNYQQDSNGHFMCLRPINMLRLLSMLFYVIERAKWIMTAVNEYLNTGSMKDLVVLRNYELITQGSYASTNWHRQVLNLRPIGPETDKLTTQPLSYIPCTYCC